jgi:quercetin dioxygenase-like cupin family protein
MTESRGRWFPIWPGVVRRTLASSETMMQMEVLLEKGSQVALHQHPHEQLSYIVRGRLRFTVGGEVREVGPGDAVLILGGVPHMVDTLEEALVIDTFSPPREDLLAIDRSAS